MYADLRFALRGLLRQPTFTLVATLTMAVGMGATASMLSIGHAVLLRPPPVAEPERMVSVWELRTGSVRESMEGRLLPYDRFEAYREATGDVFDGLAGHGYARIGLGTDEGAVSVRGFVTSGDYFTVLGLSPHLGRLFTTDDEPSFVVSERVWRSRFGADPDVIGRTFSVAGRSFVLSGVAPPGFHGTMTAFAGDVWVPWGAYTTLTGVGPNAAYVVPIGRLRDGVDPDVAEERVAAVARAIPPEHPRVTVAGARFESLLWRSDVARTLQLGLVVLLGGAALLLLTACANIAGMMLARSHDRRREFAVRLAIGAGHRRLVRQLVVESALLAVLGGAGGVALAWAGTALLSRLEVPIDATIYVDLTPDGTVLLVSFLVAALAGVAFGLGPALRAARADLSTSLKEGGARTGAPRAGVAFVVGQMALSTLLLVTAGLFARSFGAVARTPLGFDPDGVVVAGMSVGSVDYDEPAGRLFFTRVVERLGASAGVEAVGLGQFVLLGGANASHDGRAADAGDAPTVSIGFNVVDPGYFRANGVELAEGRFFTESDDADAPPVAVVNERLAERLWPGRSALGRSFHAGGTDVEVVGVVRDGVYVFANEPPAAFSYYPFAQEYRSGMYVHVRAAGDPGPVAARIREVVRELDPGIALAGLRTMDEVVSSNRFGVRFMATLAGLFALVGLFLGAVGVYGLLAVRVAQRGREFGVRMAVGARARDVLLLVLARGAGVAVAGCALGVGLAVAGVRGLDALLYEVSPYDPLTFVVVPAVLGATAIAASLIPARRATRVSPTVTLRGE